MDAVGYAAVTAAAAAASVIVGATTTSVLFCSHFHQIAGDTAASKMSPLVRLGPILGYQVHSRVLDESYSAEICWECLMELVKICVQCTAFHNISGPRAGRYQTKTLHLRNDIAMGYMPCSSVLCQSTAV